MQKSLIILHQEENLHTLPEHIFGQILSDLNQQYLNLTNLSFEKSIQCLDDVLLENGWSYLLGYKKGCAVALEYLKRNPTHSVLKLILISPEISDELNHKALLNVLRIPILNVIDSTVEDLSVIKGRNVRTVDIAGANLFPVIPSSAHSTFSEVIQSHLL